MDLALCRNESCPSRGHCFRFRAGPFYAQFRVPCDYYIPSRMEGNNGPVQA